MPPTMSAAPGAVETKPKPAGPMKVQRTMVRMAAMVKAMMSGMVLVKAANHSIRFRFNGSLFGGI